MNKTKKRQQKDKKREVEKRKKLLKNREIKRLRAKNISGVAMPSANAMTIYNFMKREKIKGDYKDFVIIAKDRLIDWEGSYNITIVEGANEGAKVGVDGIALIHKKDLCKIIPGEEADKFWNPISGRIVKNK